MARRATWRAVSAGYGHRASDRTAVPAGASGLTAGDRWRPDRRHRVSLRGYSRCAGARPATSRRLGEPGQPVALPPPVRCTHAGWRLRKPALSLMGILWIGTCFRDVPARVDDPVDASSTVLPD